MIDETLARLLALAVVGVYGAKFLLVGNAYRRKRRAADLHDYVASIVLLGAALAMLAAVAGVDVLVLTAFGLPVMLIAGMWFVAYWWRR